MKILSWNVGGLNSCIDDEDFLNLIKNFDFIFFSETWQKNNEIFSLEGYDSLYVPRPESFTSKRGHGGICILFKEQLNNGISIVEIDNTGFIWVKLDKTFFGFDDDIYLCFVYIPPSNYVYFMSHEVGFFEALERYIQKYIEYGKVSVIGDLNARCGDRSDILDCKIILINIYIKFR